MEKTHNGDNVERIKNQTKKKQNTTTTALRQQILHEQTAQMVLCAVSMFSEARVFLFCMYVTLRYLVYDTNIFFRCVERICCLFVCFFRSFVWTIGMSWLH